MGTSFSRVIGNNVHDNVGGILLRERPVPATAT